MSEGKENSKERNNVFPIHTLMKSAGQPVGQGKEGNLGQ